MEIIAYQIAASGAYRLAIKLGNTPAYKIIIVENIHGLKDLLENQNTVKCIDNSDVDGLNNYLHKDKNWCEPV
jgi:hypothetical protein